MNMSYNNYTQRNLDNERNEIMNDFLDEHLYDDASFSNVNRNSERNSQLQGVDIEFDYNGKHYVCDEKAATDYVNRDRPLGTFCLELSSMQGKSKEDRVEREGWLTNSNYINDSYLFVWVDKADSSNIEDCGKDGIRNLDICLVRKSAILNYLEQKGWSKEFLRKKAKLIREGKTENMGNIYENGFKFSYTQYYKKHEEPINILLSRETYYKLADMHKVINR